MLPLENFLHWFESTGDSWGLSIQVFSVVLLTLLIDFSVKKVLDKLYGRLKSTENPWDDGLVEAM